MFFLEDIKAMNGIAAHLFANSLSESDVEFEPRRSLGWSRPRNDEESRDWDHQYYRYITVKVEELEWDFQGTTISHLKELMNYFTTLLDG